MDIDLFEEDAPPVKRCDGCGRYFPENELRRCRACGEVFCKDCQKDHDCRHQTNNPQPINNEPDGESGEDRKYQRSQKIGKALTIFSVIAIILVISFYFGAFIYELDAQQTSESPKKTFDVYYEALKDGDSEKVWSMLSKNGQAECSEIRINNILNAKKYYGFIFHSGYEITGSMHNLNEGYLDVTITYENLYGIKYTRDFKVKCVYENGKWKIDHFDEAM